MADQNVVSLQVQLTPKDIYRFSLTTLFRRFRWFLPIAAVGVLSVTFLNVMAGQWDWSWPNLLGPAFLLLMLYGLFVSPYFGARKYLRNNASVVGPQSYIFSDSGIDVSGPHSQSHLSWEAILEVRETSSQFLFYPQTAIALVIPKHFLANPDQQASLKALVRRHVNKAKLRS
jgi:hypothetical protein